MRLSKFFTALFLVFFCLNYAFAAPAAPKIPKGGLYGAALQVAVAGIMSGVGWIMTDGSKVKRTTPATDTQPDNHTQESSFADSVPRANPPPTRVLPDSDTYPLEYCFDSNCFASVEALKDYVTGPYLKKKGYKKMRNRDGLYYTDLNVVFNNGTIYSSSNSTLGFIDIKVQAGYIDDSNPYNVGGWVHSYLGSIYYKGEENIENVTLDDRYKAKREAARKAIEKALSEAATQDVPDIAIDPTKPKDKPSDETEGETKDDAKSDSKSDSKKDTKTDSKKDAKAKENTDTKFCDWAKWFCDGDTDKQDGDVKVKELPVPSDSVNISFGGSCPASREFGFVVGGHQMAFVLSYDYLCQIAIKMGGVVKMLSTVIAAYILSGIKK